MILRVSIRFLVLLCAAVADAAFAVDAMDSASIVTRSDIVLQRPNLKPEEAMPLGNGRLGLAVWAADGLTIQLNRGDTLPGRLSPGQVVLPGLEQINSAKDYRGRL